MQFFTFKSQFFFHSPSRFEFSFLRGLCQFTHCWRIAIVSPRKFNRYSFYTLGIIRIILWLANTIFYIVYLVTFYSIHIVSHLHKKSTICSATFSTLYPVFFSLYLCVRLSKFLMLLSEFAYILLECSNNCAILMNKVKYSNRERSQSGSWSHGCSLLTPGCLPCEFSANGTYLLVFVFVCAFSCRSTYMSMYMQFAFWALSLSLWFISFFFEQ